MDQVQESYDEFNLNFRIEDTVIVNQTEMEGFNAARSVLEEAVVQGRVSFDLVEYIESVVVF